MKSFIAIALSLMVLVGGVFWFNQTPAQATEVDQEVYQLTGLPAEDTSWRPVAVSVGSAAPSISGISSASVVYEVLAQGYETTFSLMFNNIWEMPTTGPVAKASDILWQFALPQNAILIQNGWNIYAENLLNCYAYQPVDAQIEGTTAFVYNNSGDANRANEYCWYINNVEAYSVLESYGVLAQGESGSFFTFGENETATQGASALWVQYSASSGSLFSYDSATSLWSLSTLAGDCVDANNGEVVAFENVFILKADASIKDDGYTREYDLSEGTGIYLSNGAWQKITWYKGDVTDTLVVFDEAGEVLLVNEGTSYIGIYGGFSGQLINLVTDTGDLDDSVFDPS